MTTTSVPTQENVNPGDRGLGIKPLTRGEGAQGQLGGHGAHPPDIAKAPGDQVVLEPGMLGQEDSHPGRRRRPSRTKQGV